jgi:multidrug efflux system membrane fusion protein
VNTRLLVDTEQNASLAPTAAIQRNAQGTFVYLIKPDNTAAMQPVTVGTTDGSVAAVQGLQPGQVIAIAGFDKLQDGAKVSVSNASSGPNAPANSGSGTGAATGSSAKVRGNGTASSGSSSGSGGSHQ